MRIEFVINGFVDVQVGFRVRLNGTEFVVLQVSLQHFPPYHKYEIHVGSVADYRHVDCQTVAVDFDNDKRITSWRTSGFSPFDFEGTRGTAIKSPIAELARWFSETRIGDKIDRSAFIRAEVEAMDWPEVIDG